MLHTRFTRLRGLFLALIVAAVTGCFYAAPQIAQQQAKPAVAPDTSINRPSSEPYKGDLSIFEDAQRDQ
ncbi:MAG: hypothetical protein WKF84_00315 [Pyrinomonadaceae bacterium]